MLIPVIGVICIGGVSGSGKSSLVNEVLFKRLGAELMRMKVRPGKCDRCLLYTSIDRLRLSATCALLERRDVIVVSSVSCIYGLGEPDDFAQMVICLLYTSRCV